MGNTMDAVECEHEHLERWLAPVPILFTQLTWRRMLVLGSEAILTTHRRTVTATLRAAGRAHDAKFSRYHAVLSRSRWSLLAAARLLLGLLIAAFVPVVIGLDDTIKQRWGARIAVRGIYRDPARSNYSHFVNTSGLRWLSVMLLVPIPWVHWVWALLFLTQLVPSER